MTDERERERKEKEKRRQKQKKKERKNKNNNASVCNANAQAVKGKRVVDSMPIRGAVDDESINFVSTLSWTLGILNEWRAFFDGWSFTYYLSREKPAYVSLSNSTCLRREKKRKGERGRGVRWDRKWSFLTGMMVDASGRRVAWDKWE